MRFLLFAAVLLAATCPVYSQTGFCQNVNDLSSISAAKQSLQQCATQCLSDKDKPQCILDFLSTKAKLSATCSTCVAGIEGCVTQSCAASCGGSAWATECVSCASSKCSANIHQCFGSPAMAIVPQAVSSIMADGVCQDADDIPHLKLEAGACFLLCQLNSNPTTCTVSCLENDNKFTSLCRSCITNAAGCFNNNCFKECTKGLLGEGCIPCGQSKCGIFWTACMGNGTLIM